VTVVWLVYADGKVWMQTTRDPQVLYRSIRQFVASPEDHAHTEARVGDRATHQVARFTALDVPAMKRMNGRP
jgi:hypothetical protein